ncbi:superinfection immunity protein [Stenotrophomonas bentonitica]|nr:superinfection immunity protein [Stenotrophomonas bentonitica]
MNALGAQMGAITQAATAAAQNGGAAIGQVNFNAGLGVPAMAEALAEGDTHLLRLPPRPSWGRMGTDRGAWDRRADGRARRWFDQLNDWRDCWRHRVNDPVSNHKRGPTSDGPALPRAQSTNPDSVRRLARLRVASFAGRAKEAEHAYLEATVPGVKYLASGRTRRRRRCPWQTGGRPATGRDSLRFRFNGLPTANMLPQCSKGFDMVAVRLAVLLFLVAYSYSMGQIPPDGLNPFGKLVAGLFFLFAPMLYLLPSYEAWRGNHHNLIGVVLVNVLLGWTLLGWVVGLVWSVLKPASPAMPAAAPEESDSISPPPARATKRCPFCAEDVLYEAIKCKHCGSELPAR